MKRKNNKEIDKEIYTYKKYMFKDNIIKGNGYLFKCAEYSKEEKLTIRIITC